MLHTKSFIAAVAFAFVGNSAMAGTALETAVANGGEVLDADSIAELIIGKAVTAKSGDKTFRFYYDPSNVVHGELTNGGWQGSGAFAITDNGQVCVSMAADKGRYRCLTLVRTYNGVQKFNIDGKMTFKLSNIVPSTGL